ncbi:O-antigen ligase family protein [uncultured Porphyromonas sp.]|uniref:O-antigen ligase family protein n=1 Tax=uncultured Porphyromonas sp. TaxID=159274 RepID=UPI00261BBE55|nr:O-antigen ligase family protein [uncultured Porphyromonas sp.]
MKINILKVYRSATFLTLSSGLLYFFKSLQTLSYALFGIGSLLFILGNSVFSRTKGGFTRLTKIQIIVLVMMFIISLVSTIIEQNPKLMATGFLFVIVYYFLGIYLQSVNFQAHRKIRLLCINVLCISTVLAILSFIQGIPTLDSIIYGYSGLFDNPNKLGLCLAPATVISGTLFISSINQNYISQRNRILLIILFVFFLLIVISSASRTSLIAVLLPILTSIIIKSFPEKPTKKNILASVSIIAILVILSFTLYNSEFFQTLIVGKFNRTEEGGELLSGRAELWATAWKYSKIIGSNNLFSQTSDLGAHNTFFAYLIRYGYIFLFLYLFTFLLIIIASIRFYRKVKGNPYSIIPFIITLSTFIIFMAEQAFTSMNNFLVLLCYAVTLTPLDIEKHYLITK